MLNQKDIQNIQKLVRDYLKIKLKKIDCNLKCVNQKNIKNIGEKYNNMYESLQPIKLYLDTEVSR